MDFWIVTITNEQNKLENINNDKNLNQRISIFLYSIMYLLCPLDLEDT